MSDREFEIYLKLLASLLQLNEAQRQSIAQELRQHLEDRLEDLCEQGYSRPAAIEMALSELGDASGMAAQFTFLSHRKRKRWFMKMATVSVAACFLLVVASISLWPGGRIRLITPSGAQDPFTSAATPEVPQQEGGAGSDIGNPFGGWADAGDPFGGGGVAQADFPSVNENEDRVRELLSQPLVSAIPPMSMSDMARHFSETLDIHVMIEARALEEEGLDAESLEVAWPFANTRGSTVLKLMLKTHELTYKIVDGVLIVTTRSNANEEAFIRVYPCLELIEEARKFGAGNSSGAIRSQYGPLDAQQGGGGLGPGGGGLFSLAETYPSTQGSSLPKAANPTPTARQDDAQAKPAAIEAGKPRHQTDVDHAMDLMNLIQTAVAPETWEQNGGPVGAAVSYYNGKLVVRQTEEVHVEVERLLHELMSRK